MKYLITYMYDNIGTNFLFVSLFVFFLFEFPFYVWLPTAISALIHGRDQGKKKELCNYKFPYLLEILDSK